MPNGQLTDKQGFLIDAKSWSEDWCVQISNLLEIELNNQDMKIINALRDFYFEFDLSPPMRPLVKHIKNNFGADIGNSIWLMKRYGESPARVLSQLAGLPKPKNCL